MRRSGTKRFVGVVAVACALGATPSCGKKDASDGPTPAPFGFDTRPANAGCGPFARPVSTSPAIFAPAFGGLAVSAPIDLRPVPGARGDFFVAERAGRVLRVNANAPASASVVLDIRAEVNASGEGGLLGIAPHPRFAENGFLYLSYTTAGGPSGLRSVVSRVTSRDGGRSFAEESPVIGPFDQPYSNHNGGHLEFGPTDGLLYVGFGDGGSGGDPLGNGQKTTGFFSKILRVDVDRGTPYAIPDGNPFKGRPQEGAPELFAYGFRNPWRFSFDRETGELWVGDVGQNAWEEIDVVHAGGNYGWNAREGTHCYTDATCNGGPYEDPIYEYDHKTGNSITGGFVYRGKAVPALAGAYVFGDFANGAIWTLRRDASGAHVARLNDQGPSGNWASFAEDEDGELYAIDLNGALYKLAPTPEAGTGRAIPARLSETGCVDVADPSHPAPFLVPYEVASPLWSDGAEKERAFVVPDGKVIGVREDGDLDLPVGSVVVKVFRLGGRPVETRLLVRHDDGDWGGYSYQWNDEGTDATLLPDERKVVVALGLQAWTFPSRRDCLTCHTEAAGRTLGLELAQLGGETTYRATHRRSRQIDTLEHVGLIDPGGPRPPSLPSPGAPSVPAESRVRSYFHANCSHCHRPAGPARGTLDLRFSSSLAASGLCAPPQVSDLGIPDARIVAPGNPSRSLAYVRLRAYDGSRMPPLATSSLDVDAALLLERWINGLSTCP